MNKKVNIIDKSTGNMMRTPRSLAEQLVAAGTHHYTSKSKLKSFLNQQGKLYRNAELLKNVDFSKKQDKNFISEENGKVYGYVLKKWERRMEGIEPEKVKERKMKWWEKVLHTVAPIFGAKFEPKLVEVLEEKKLKVVDYPKYTRYPLDYK